MRSLLNTQSAVSSLFILLVSFIILLLHSTYQHPIFVYLFAFNLKKAHLKICTK